TDHCIKGVGDGEEPCAEGDVISCQPVRIALTVPAFVMMSNDGSGPFQKGYVSDDFRAYQGMSAHQSPLLVSQRARLPKDVVGNSDLSNIMKNGASDQIIEPGGR